MTKALAQTYTAVHAYRVAIMRLLCAACAIATIWYGINVYQAISRTIATEHMVNETSLISNTVNQLGSQYIQLSDDATPSALSKYGMSLGKVSVYIPRTTSLGSVALSGHEF
jgi:hypothetical protein